ATLRTGQANVLITSDATSSITIPNIHLITARSVSILKKTRFIARKHDRHDQAFITEGLVRSLIPLALHALAQELAVTAHRPGLFAGAPLRGLLVITPQF